MILSSLAMASSTVLCPNLGTRTVSLLSISTTPHAKIQSFHLYRRLLSPWNGLKQLGISTKPKPLFHIGRKGRCKGKLVYASLFGVGAPEALVIGVVALLVFGPKGLAEVARNLGKTLREFQPTIREIQDVSRDFKSTLEREIGLDEISNPTRNTYSSNVQNTTSAPSSTDSTNNVTSDPNRAYSSEEYLKITEEQLKASAAKQQEQISKEGENEQQIQPPANEMAATGPPPQKPESETFPQDL